MDEDTGEYWQTVGQWEQESEERENEKAKSDGGAVREIDSDPGDPEEGKDSLPV